jgi:dodecin
MALLGRQATTEGTNGRHEHRTAKVTELIGASTVSFDDAIRNTIDDACATIRGVTGAEIEHMNVKIVDGRIAEYKVNLKVAFGIERTPNP